MVEKVAQYSTGVLSPPICAQAYAKNRATAVKLARENVILNFCNKGMAFKTRGAINRLKYPCGRMTPKRDRRNVIPINNRKIAALGIVPKTPTSPCLASNPTHTSAISVHNSVKPQRRYMPLRVLVSMVLYTRLPRKNVFTEGGM